MLPSGADIKCIIFAEPEENNYFSIITLGDYQSKCIFFFILFVSSIEVSRNRAAAKLVLQYYNHYAHGDYSKI